MITNPLVSVIIPAYKAEKYIEETIRSVLNQTYENVEIIVVNDGSPDNLESIVRKLQLEDDRLKYYKIKNLGVSYARNYGYSKSSGEYLAFLDADDVWLPNNLELKLKKFLEDDSFGLVHSDAQVFNSESHLLNEFLQGKEGFLLDDLLCWNGCCVPAPSSILVKRSVFETVKGFDENLSTSADKDFFIRVSSIAKIGRIEQVTWYYRVHENNMSKNITLMEKDITYLYQKVSQMNLFKSEKFRKKCFSHTYWVLAGSWWKNAKNKKRGIYYLIKSILTNPFILKEKLQIKFYNFLKFYICAVLQAL